MDPARSSKDRLTRTLLLAIIVCLLIRGVSTAAFQDQPVGLRLIEVASDSEAHGLRAQVEAGGSFADLARAHSLDTTSDSGGYLGSVLIGNLREEFQDALTGLNRGDTSGVVIVEDSYFLFQLVTEAEEDTLALTAQGRRSVAQGQSLNAEEYFEAAVEAAEGLGRSGRSLLIDGLLNLSALMQIQGRDPESQQMYARSMDVFWGAPSAAPDPGVGRVLAALADVVDRGTFQAEESEIVFAHLTDAIGTASLEEKLYWAIGGILDVAGLSNQTESMLMLAVENFPDSTASLRHLADHHVNSGKVRQAIEEFERAIEIEPDRGVDPSLGVVQKSYLYQRIGDAYGSLALYDEAVEAYRLALEIDPGNPDARFELGIIHYLSNRFDDALLEYDILLETNPANAEVIYNVAQVQLGQGQFAEAVESSRRALRIEPDHGKSRYVLGTSLIRMGDTEEGRSELARFGELEASEVAADNLGREVASIKTGAMDEVSNGEYEQAVVTYREAIDAYPEVPLFRLSLASAQSLLDQHEEALQSLEAIVELGLSDHWLLHRRLAEEYEYLGDSESSQRHARIYLQRLDQSLRTELD
jgi:tetratricopeptide (TPR) repeat protein